MDPTTDNTAPDDVPPPIDEAPPPPVNTNGGFSPGDIAAINAALNGGSSQQQSFTPGEIAALNAALNPSSPPAPIPGPSSSPSTPVQSSGGGSTGVGGSTAAQQAASTLDQQLSKLLQALSATNEQDFQEKIREFNTTHDLAVQQFQQGVSEFNQNLAEKQREFGADFGEKQREFNVGVQENMADLAGKLTGPRDYFQFLNATNAGRNIVQSLTNGQPRPSFGATGPTQPMTVADILNQLGVNGGATQGGAFGTGAPGAPAGAAPGQAAQAFMGAAAPSQLGGPAGPSTIGPASQTLGNTGPLGGNNPGTTISGNRGLQVLSYDPYTRDLVVGYQNLQNKPDEVFSFGMPGADTKMDRTGGEKNLYTSPHMSGQQGHFTIHLAQPLQPGQQYRLLESLPQEGGAAQELRFTPDQITNQTSQNAALAAGTPIGAGVDDQGQARYLTPLGGLSEREMQQYLGGYAGPTDVPSKLQEMYRRFSGGQASGTGQPTLTQAPQPQAPAQTAPQQQQPIGAPAQQPIQTGSSGLSVPNTNVLLPYPHQINPAVWDSLGTTGQQFLMGAYSAAGFDPNEALSQINATRPSTTRAPADSSTSFASSDLSSAFA